VPQFVNYKKGCNPLTAASDKVYQLLAQVGGSLWSIPASSTTKTGRHDIADILLKVALKHKNIPLPKDGCFPCHFINFFFFT
jgi:hypothetical protein